MKRTLRNVKRHLTVSNILLYMFMFALTAFMALPIIFVLNNAFKPLDELFLFPPQFFVRRPTVRNFTDLLMVMGGGMVPFTRYLFNSIITTVSAVGLSVIICSMGAFAVSKCKLPGAAFMFNVIIAALMFSPHVTQIPTYMIVQSLRMLDTYWALILPNVAVAFNFFLMKQFIDQFPDSLIEASRIDGASHNQLFWRVLMPNLAPAWSTLIVFTFVARWNDFFGPLIYIRNQAMRTLPLALGTIGAGGGIGRAGAVSAATFLVTIPTLIIFLVMQGRVIETMTHSGIKA